MRSAALLRNSAFVFVLASFSLLARMVNRKEIYAPEVQIMIWLLMPQLSGGLAPSMARLHPLATKIWILLISGIVFFLTWFWYRGLDWLPKTGCRDDYVFVFAKVSVYHWFRTFSKVIFTFSAIHAGYAALVTIFFWRIPDESQEGSDYLVWLMVVVWPISIAGCEMTLKWNHVTDVYTLRSPSQLVPLMLGVGQLVDTIYRVVQSRVKDEEDSEEDENDYVACSHKVGGGGRDVELTPLPPS
ncbi:uncharacterized protein BDR25DRAFT_300046 [Lindgomyces ingoldianus]|uniref:Uncharacterized protein n=1 Tax=Lindgomyces ingoldianus TaxID=673940 RepID=A0ACB6RC60_9PLEO|nr:uncharacterized protein BDR25DRAFT_300046 [Lindgomyces ingoldianus]KAF2476914.1 hypothetical protein BDR25DRAFT_300046 [Lindgomyces ingoldianus]